MAVSGKTSGLEIPYYLGTDKPPDMAAVTKAMAERLQELLAQAPGAHFESHGVALTRATNSLGAFSTPIKLTLPQVKAGQVVEIVASGFVKSTIESGPVSGLGLQVAVGGTPIGELGRASEILAANTFCRFFAEGASASHQSGLILVQATPHPAPSSFLGKVLTGSQMRFIATAEATNVVVELQGECTSGTVTIEDVYFGAHVWG